MAPRVAVQRVTFSPDYPTNIDIPIYSGTYTAIEDNEPNEVLSTINAVVYPNPANSDLNVFMNVSANYEVRLLTITGKAITLARTFNDNITLDVNALAAGVYFVEITDKDSQERIVKKINVE
jgi:hypothetical protein